MEIMEVTKRTYQKHKTEKKITIKHYVNTDVKVDNDSGFTMYALYVQVTYNRKNTKFRSNIPYSLSENIPHPIPIFDNILEYKNFYLGIVDNIVNNFENDFDSSFEGALIREANFINWLINQQIRNRPDEFTISEISTIYHLEAYQLVDFIEDSLKKEIQSTLFKITEYYTLNEIFKDSKFPIFNHISALDNLEFYISQYPQLASLKKKYPSHIWLLDIYLSQPELNNGIELNPVFSITNPHDKSIIPFAPTMFDYITYVFQMRFIGIFRNKEFACNIINDIDAIFKKYIKIYD